jgi:hypothetical protein
LLRAHSRRLIPLRSNSRKISTDDSTLVLHSSTRALLGNLLCDTLLVHATVHLCPGDLAGIFTLEEQGGIFGVGEAEYLNK